MCSSSFYLVSRRHPNQTETFADVKLTLVTAVYNLITFWHWNYNDVNTFGLIILVHLLLSVQSILFAKYLMCAWLIVFYNVIICIYHYPILFQLTPSTLMLYVHVNKCYVHVDWLLGMLILITFLCLNVITFLCLNVICIYRSSLINYPVWWR